VPPARNTRHEHVSAQLAALDDTDLAALVAAGRTIGTGVGGTTTVIDTDDIPVFVKRIPLTEPELARPLGTANLFDLPMFCQYGINSPGFNAWRELAANLVVTDAVLAGETESFPLLHHWRVLPGRPPVAAEYADIDAAVAALDGSPAVRARLAALAAAPASLVLCWEYLPYPAPDWLRTDPAGKAETVEDQLCGIVTALRDNDLLHMDGHFGNLRSDGERLYLTDFGLATSPRFELSPAEREFAGRNATHDAQYAAMRLVNWLVTAVCGITDPAGGGPVARNAYVARCAADGVPADVPTPVAAILARHAPVAARMNDFYWQLFGGNVHARYPLA
jgi:hypothetical protein